MKLNELREFVHRDWGKITELDRSYWKSEYRRKGFTSTLKASQALWEHMRSIQPEWPDGKERQRDLDHHIAQKQLIVRISNDFLSHKPSVGS